jgi:hypothetical protein
MSTKGHQSIKEVERYIKAVEQKRLAVAAIEQQVRAENQLFQPQPERLEKTGILPIFSRVLWLVAPRRVAMPGGTSEWLQDGYLDVNQRAAYFQIAYSSAPHARGRVQISRCASGRQWRVPERLEHLQAAPPS